MQGGSCSGPPASGKIGEGRGHTLGYECTVVAQTTLEARLERSQRTSDLIDPQFTITAAARARRLAALAQAQ